MGLFQLSAKHGPIQSMARTAALLVCLAGAAPFPAAADFQSGWDAWRRGRYETALDEFQAAAVAGDVRAALALAQMYETGRGVERDPAEALRWRGQAASAGHAGTQFELGRDYLNGTGVARDPVRAAYWLREAASQGHPNAQLALGGLLLEEPEHAGEGVRWIQEAAKAGLVEADLALAEAFERGTGVPKDARRAAELRVAAIARRDQAANEQEADLRRQIEQAHAAHAWCHHFGWYYVREPYYTPYRWSFGSGIFYPHP